jgi:hypothetical protein
VSDPSVPSPSQPYAQPPADGGSATAPPSPEPPYDPREKQIELLTDAVTALRQEIGRSYEYSQRLTQENEKLRGVVAGLRRELAKEKGGSKALREQLAREPHPRARAAAAAPAAKRSGRVCVGGPCPERYEREPGTRRGSRYRRAAPAVISAPPRPLGPTA